MKHADNKLFAIALAALAALAAFAPRQSFAITGSEAAAMITSNPVAYGFEPEKASDIQISYYDKGAKKVEIQTVPIKDASSFEDVSRVIESLQQTVTSVALNSLFALGKIAFLEAESKRMELSVKTLELTTKDAFAALDELDIDAVTDEVSFRLSKKKTTDGKTVYETKTIIGAEPDGKSIVKNAEKKLALYELPGVSDSGKIPYWGGSTLSWFFFKDLLDNTSISAKLIPSSSSIASNGIGLKSWDTPTESPNGCVESIAQQLSRLPNQPETHYVLTKLISDGNLHYTPLGRLAGIGSAPDETTITTNGVTKGILQIKNADAKDKILVSTTGGDNSAPAWTTPAEITVIKDIDFVTNGDGTIKLVLHREKIKCIPNDDSSVDDKDVTIATSAISLVSGTEYDESDHSFYDNVKTVRVIGTPSEDTRRVTPTFTAVEHQTE